MMYQQMKIFHTILLYAILILHPFWVVKGNGAQIRERRSLFDMALTLWCYRNQLQIPLIGINLYGCHCGPGGSGIAVDAVDHCCFLHDCCYRHCRVSLKCHFKVKWQKYNFMCLKSQTECTSRSICGRMACECDNSCRMSDSSKPKKQHFLYNKKHLCPGPKDVCPIFPNKTEIHRWTKKSSVSQNAIHN
ncbi:phospholipase A2, minor isoenzyme [Microcaecilia unicolor]|uniref:Phospholipase A2 n=1 Tax=Microcaecilia unicolor TaxID=1415580 RepID=A0A6P7Y1U6_9AMPH|nr:phospholipase A2, minor isoenzyme-like [Microcaecilia unicolor]XP_030056805.1 phospholipase A2, minor isoenzyme-like [Microcaecilia unicolor]